MTEEKKERLKALTKVKLLAKRAGIHHVYLSRILKGKEQASAVTAELLAKFANELTLQEGYFVASDFRPDDL
jgi:transcriptional regulator with XRE-family HTH domain